MDGDVTDIETEKAPTLEELQAQIKAQNDALAKMQQNEALYLQALAEKDAGRRPAPAKQEETGDDEPLDAATQKALAKMQAQHAKQLTDVQDQFDEMSFYQYAASASLDPATVAETSKMYADYRAQGVRVRGGDGVERPMTRADVLYQVIGKREISNAFKAAPEKNLAALKSKIIGAAGYDGGGSYEGGPRLVKIDSEIDKLSNKEKASKLDKALTGVEF